MSFSVARVKAPTVPVRCARSQRQSAGRVGVAGTYTLTILFHFRRLGLPRRLRFVQQEGDRKQKRQVWTKEVEGKCLVRNCENKWDPSDMNE